MDIFKLIGILVGSALIAAYVIRSYQRNISVQLGNAVFIFLSAIGLLAGVKVILFSFNGELNDLVKHHDIDIAYIFLGGIAICWASIHSAIQAFGLKK